MILNSALKGESWLGLQSLHTLTSQRSYKLKITMTDFDGEKYDAVYDHFKVRLKLNPIASSLRSF